MYPSRIHPHRTLDPISRGLKLVREVPVTLDEQVAQFEKQKIEEALAQTQSNITQAAKMLGPHRSKLSRKVKDYRLKKS